MPQQPVGSLACLVLLSALAAAPAPAQPPDSSETGQPRAARMLLEEASTPVISVGPVRLSAPGRGEDLQVRVSAPVTGRQLPIIIFSHGNGASADAYAPLVDFWAGHGFVVVQPTHLDSRSLALAADDLRTPHIWRFREEDLKRVLDHLDQLEATVPGLKGRVDRSRIAVAGHSYGGETAGMLLGERVTDPRNGETRGARDPRVKAGVLLATPGRGGGDLSAMAAKQFPFMNPDFTGMATPALVIAGDKDQSPLTVRGPDWFIDPYFLSPGPKCLVVLFGARHSLGGIAGYRVTETSDENPDRVAAVQRLTWAFLRSTLYPNSPAWPAARAAFAAARNPLGRAECK